MSDAPTSREDIPARPDRTSEDTDHGGTDGCDASSARGLDHINMNPGPRRTRNMELLLTEARFADEGKEIDNPAKPCGPNAAREGFVQDAIERIHEEGLTPAWRVCPRGDSNDGE